MEQCLMHMCQRKLCPCLKTAWLSSGPIFKSEELHVKEKVRTNIYFMYLGHHHLKNGEKAHIGNSQNQIYNLLTDPNCLESANERKHVRNPLRIFEIERERESKRKDKESANEGKLVGNALRRLEIEREREWTSKDIESASGGTLAGNLLRRLKTERERESKSKLKEIRQGIERHRIQDRENNAQFRKTSDDTIIESLVHQYSQSMKSVGCMVSQYGKGTIFRVGSRYGMTAAHVIKNIINPHNLQKDDYSLLCKDQISVYFSEEGPRFKLDGKVVFLDFSLDVAIVAFSNENIRDLPPALSLLSCCAYSLLKEVAVIGYGHRKNDFKCLEHSVEVIDPNRININTMETYIKQSQFKHVLKCIGKDSSCVDEGYNGYNDYHRILLNAYLGPGASGSPILSKANPAAVQVVGIYTCGYPKVAYEIPTTMTFLDDHTFEAGTKMDFIFKALKSKNQELADEIFRQ